MRFHDNFRFAFVAILLCALVGCVSMPGRRSAYSSGTAKDAASLEVANLLRFEDIPVPYVFKIHPEESFAFQNDFSRVGLLRYTGKHSPDELVKFFKEQMPLYRWEMVNIIEFGRRVLNFEKNGQNCIVMVERASSKTSLIIAVAPKSSSKGASALMKPLKKSE